MFSLLLYVFMYMKQVCENLCQIFYFLPCGIFQDDCKFIRRAEKRRKENNRTKTISWLNHKLSKKILLNISFYWFSIFITVWVLVLLLNIIQTLNIYFWISTFVVISIWIALFYFVNKWNRRIHVMIVINNIELD